jgi:predicted kinase
MVADSSMTNLFIYLVGFAGTGKLTIAQALARLVDAKVVDNHWINNPIFGLIDADGVTPLPATVWDQVAKVREAVLETIATLASPTTNFILTHEGVEGDPVDRAIFESIRSTAARRGARFVPVRLLCEEDELVRRIQSPERAGLFKCIDPADAINKSRHHAVLDPLFPTTLTLDVTALGPEESAAAILAHVRGCVAGEAAEPGAGKP